MKRKGPVPTGLVFAGLALMSVPSYRWRGSTAVSAGSALRMSWNGVGLEKRNTAVSGSGVSTASRS
jgi:hypothetical protein